MFFPRETLRFDRPQNSILMTYLYRDSLVGCCTGLNFHQQREPIRGPPVASRHWYKIFRLAFASHEAEGLERSAALKYWSIDLLFCVEFVEITSKILTVGEMKDPRDWRWPRTKQKIFFVRFDLTRSEKNNSHKKSEINLQDICMSTFAENCC